MSHLPSRPSRTKLVWRVHIRRASLILAPLAIFAAVPGPVQAQIFVGIDRHQTAPTAQDVSPQDLASEPAVASVAVTSVVRHLPHTLEGFYIAGETGTLQWPVYLTRPQTARPLKFQLAYLSAISVLEDVSSLSLRVNGRTIGAARIDASQAGKTVDFDIPPGLMVHGYNAIALVLQQRHRVDCSVAATYELWTRIDPAATGLVQSPGRQDFNEIADLPALSLRPDGTFPVRIVLGAKAGGRQVERLLKATQSIAIAGGFQQPAVDFGPMSEEPEGMNLVLGTRATLQTLALPAEASGTSGPLVKFVAAAGGGRPALIVTGSTEAELDAAIAQLAGPRALDGSAEGLRAAANYPGHETNGEARLTLAELGLVSQEFSGRLLRQSFDLTLPADFLPADYARGSFDLAGGYNAGLTRDARVRLDVNGRNAGQLSLPKAGGDMFRHNQMFLPLGLFQPGVNRIDIYAETPALADTACAPGSGAKAGNRFLLLDSSELTLPRLARAQRLPALDLMAAGSLPYLTGRPQLFVPKPDRETMGAALSLIARLGVAAGRALPFAFTVTRPTGDDGSTLAVADARSLDPALLREAGLDPEAVETAWRSHTDDMPAAPGAEQWWTQDASGSAACHVPVVSKPAASAPGLAPVAQTASPPAGDDGLFERWTENIKGPAPWPDRFNVWRQQLNTSVTRMTALLPAFLRDAPAPPLSSGATLIIAQGMSATAPGHVTTVVTAPNPALLRASAACLEDPQVWAKLRGRLAVLSAASGAITTAEPARLAYFAPMPLSVTNSRLVLAGWFSLNPLAFACGALLIAACLSGTTLLFVRGIGRRIKR